MVRLIFNPKNQTKSSEVDVKSKSTKCNKVQLGDISNLNLNPFESIQSSENPVECSQLQQQSELKIKDLVGLESTHYLLKNWYTQDPKKHFLLIGPTGCGKTTLVELFCKENNILLFTTKVTENVKTKKDLLKELMLFKCYSNDSNAFFNDRNATCVKNKKMILIDEYQNGQNDLLSITDIVGLDFSIPVIIISSDSKGSKLSELKKVCETYYINEIGFQPIKTWISMFIKDHKIKINEKDLDKLIRSCKSDKRLLINNVLFYTGTKSIDNFYKDEDLNIFEYINKVFDNIEPVETNEVFKVHESDGYLLGNLVHENYLDYNDDIDAIARSAEAISYGDIIFSDTFESNKTFIEYAHCVNSILIPSYYSRSDYKKNKVPIRSSTINNRYNILLNNGKIINKINESEFYEKSIYEIFFIKKFINQELIKSKTHTIHQTDYLGNIVNSFRSEDKIDKLELIYKHFSDFKTEPIIKLAKEFMDRYIHLNLSTDQLNKLTVILNGIMQTTGMDIKYFKELKLKEPKTTKEVKTRNFTIKFKDKLNKLININ